MKHINVALFVVHKGCPHTCSFCNQRSISGRASFCPETVSHEIEAALATISDGTKAEIAFFGGALRALTEGL